MDFFAQNCAHKVLKLCLFCAHHFKFPPQKPTISRYLGHKKANEIEQ
jgi:hypothetical protein